MQQQETPTITARIFKQKLLTPFAAFLLAVCCVAGTATACLWRPTPTNEQRYEAAVQDSIAAEADELLPLVTITPDSDMTTWKDGKVLLMSFHRRPERYVAGETLAVPGEVWTFTDKELAAWYAKNKTGVTDWPMRFKQLVGVPPDGTYTHVSAMWVSPQDVQRPAYQTDITVPDMTTTLPENTDETYLEWFSGNIIWSYFDSAYPWTRLGYTYDWGATDTEYGLTEFLVKKDAKVDVEYTETIEDLIVRLEQP